ncbi:MAG: hypothetical protein H6713_24745 [Myxococcales bacterium]|nr:hypothetical protein [Myxococcales bacterium]
MTEGRARASVTTKDRGARPRVVDSEDEDEDDDAPLNTMGWREAVTVGLLSPSSTRSCSAFESPRLDASPRGEEALGEA